MQDSTAARSYVRAAATSSYLLCFLFSSFLFAPTRRTLSILCTICTRLYLTCLYNFCADFFSCCLLATRSIILVFCTSLFSFCCYNTASACLSAACAGMNHNECCCCLLLCWHWCSVSPSRCALLFLRRVFSALLPSLLLPPLLLLPTTPEYY